MHGFASVVEYGQPDPAEVAPESGRPDHRGDAGFLEIQLTDRRALERSRGGWCRLGRGPDAGPLDVGVDGAGEHRHTLVASGQQGLHVVSQVQARSGDSAEMPQQNDAVVAIATEIDVVAAADTGDQRVGPLARLRPLLERLIERAQLLHPPEHVPSTVTALITAVAGHL